MKLKIKRTNQTNNKFLVLHLMKLRCTDKRQQCNCPVLDLRRKALKRDSKEEEVLEMLFGVLKKSTVQR